MVEVQPIVEMGGGDPKPIWYEVGGTLGDIIIDAMERGGGITDDD